MVMQGPGDSLSHAQTAWIHQLLEAGAAVELCHVSVWEKIEGE